MGAEQYSITYDKWGNASAATAYKLCKVSAAQTIDVTAADTDIAVAVTTMESAGVAQNEAVPALPLVPGRIYEVTASAAVTAGDEVAPEAAGKAKTAAATDRVVGIAYTAGSADNAVFKIVAVGTYIKA